MTNGHYICPMKRKIFREDILKAGLEIMFDNGYNATGIKEITDRVQIPKGSFYNHFENKEAFGLEVLQTYCDNGVRLHKKRLEHSDAPYLQRLEDMYTGMIANYSENLQFKKGCVMSNFSTELADVNEKFREVLDRQFNEIEAIIANTLKKAQGGGTLDANLNSEATAAFILNSWHGALVRMKATASDKPLLDFKRMIFTQILN